MTNSYKAPTKPYSLSCFVCGTTAKFKNNIAKCPKCRAMWLHKDGKIERTYEVKD